MKRSESEGRYGRGRDLAQPAGYARGPPWHHCAARRQPARSSGELYAGLSNASTSIAT
uniref:Uncharacterized protein n=1 Tax=Oryza sativa subsp. japonica TaxID=39947 RepID=Q6Z5M8_ORYSJ|nr:hypothetical protein [Oryza sativa Japonica Group]BAD13021.1 hypothetical protein [Oryza sativa Japonica Group]